MRPQIDLKHRTPKFDFSGVSPFWAPRNPEFSIFFVAGSTGAPAVEPYLNRVMAQAKPLLKTDELRRDVEIFIKQETAHFTVHNSYNAEIARHLPAVAAGEERKRKDYQRFLATKSHKFNCAYSAGFETLALSMALFLFEKCDDLLADADPRTLAMWQWHLAEEYEHRAVCHEVYNALYGDYIYRAYMVVYAFLHLARHNKVIVGELLAEHRRGMGPRDLEASLRRERIFKRRFLAFHIRHILRLLTPGYSPRRVRPPRGAQELLDAYAAT